VPVLSYWGADLGPVDQDALSGLAELRRPGVPHSALDDPRYLSVLPQTTSGFTGTPAVEGWRVGTGGPTPAWSEWSSETARTAHTGATVRARDREAGLSARVDLELTASGVLLMRTTLTNDGPGDYLVTAVRNVLPVGTEATELLDLTGRWCRERSPQRHPWHQGSWVRDGRHGRTGHDATLLMIAGTPGFSWSTGTVWASHVAWSGDSTAYAERTPEGEALLGGGELLSPGEIVLAEGESYVTPWLLGSFSCDGLDALSARLHHHAREQAPHPGIQRPVVLNTWEATYFSHEHDRLAALADAAADLGVERFVLDDGWFSGRRSDLAGLGDWIVDPDVYPEGLHRIAEHVHRRGMQLGLWVEPEMVNMDSALARAHPDWVLRGRAALPAEWRHQHVLDLQNPDAFAHVRDALLALLDEYPIRYLKWDHNRDLIDAAHAGRPAVHGQTLAVYALIDALRAAHPELEIESCASGGGRVDLEILSRTDRIWPSDTNDAVERQQIQRWTGLLVPPEMMGCHVGGPVAHTTGRSHRLRFRAATALLGHFGIEWDVTTLTTDERTELAAWVALHKEVRALVSAGTLVHPEHADPAVRVTGVVAADLGRAVFVIAIVASTLTQAPTPVRFTGLDNDATYSVRAMGPPASEPVSDLGGRWLDQGPVDVPGRVLMRSGLQLPATAPESAYVIEVRATTGSDGH
jgi:alpha-galactosidase